MRRPLYAACVFIFASCASVPRADYGAGDSGAEKKHALDSDTGGADNFSGGNAGGGGEAAAQGDVAIWGATAANPYGHVAVVMAAGERGAWFAEQHGFTQRGVEGRWREYAGSAIWRPI